MNNLNPWMDNPVLFSSVLRDDYEVFVDKLYHYSSLINTPNIYGETLLHYACFLGMVDKYDALVNFDTKIEKTQQGNSLLHYCSFSGYDNFLITALVKHGQSPIETNEDNQTPIHFSGNSWICQYFYFWAKNKNIKIPLLLDKNGNTVAHISKEQGKIESFNYWIKKFPELLNIENHAKLTPDKVITTKNIRYCTLISL